jgi:hypothetical protein
MKTQVRIKVTLSRGEFYRAVEMEYYSLFLTKDFQVHSGDKILLECEEYKADSVFQCLLVREVVDWDCVDFMDFNKDKYLVIVRNNNYRS